MTPDTRTLTIPAADGVPAHTLAVHEWNHTAPRHLICVHGLTRNGRDFDALAESLTGYYRGLCPDMPGRGDSPKLENPAGYNYALYQHGLLHMMEALNIPRADWVGTSMGGILGMMVAASQPKRIRRLVLNDIGAHIPREGLLRLGEYVGRKMEYASRAEAEVAVRGIYAAFGIAEERHWQKLFAASFEDTPQGGARMRYDPAIGLPFADPEKVQDVDLWGIWESITCPVLILRGAESDILTHETAMRMQALRPDITDYVQIPGAGHAPSLMRHEEISLIRRFLMEE